MGAEATSSGSNLSPLTASELRGLPKNRRDAIMEEAARSARQVYCGDRSLTDFEAFDEEVRIPMATVRTRIGPGDHGRVMTLEEFREADEEQGFRYELSRGVVEVTEVPNDPHGQVVSNLEGMTHRYKDRRPDVIRRIGGAGEFRLWVPEMVSGRNPDMAIVFRDAPKDNRGRRRPALVVEVVSAGGEDRDDHLKREEYWTFGIQEYWIVDRSLCQLLILVREGDLWAERTCRGADVIVSELLPEFAGTVAELWVDVEDDD